MKLALVLGASSQSIAQKLIQTKDNLVIDYFSDIDSLIDNSIQRGYYFDRILFSSNVVKSDMEGILGSLDNYMREYCPHTNAVMMCRKDSEEELASYFSTVFNSPLHTALLFSRTTLQTTLDSAVEDIGTLKQRYGVSNQVTISIEEDSYDIPQPVQQTQNQQPRGKKKKKGFFSRFAKEKSQNVEQQNQNVTPQQDMQTQATPDMQNDFNENQYEGYETSNESFEEANTFNEDENNIEMSYEENLEVEYEDTSSNQDYENDEFSEENVESDNFEDDSDYSGESKDEYDPNEPIDDVDDIPLATVGGGMTFSNKADLVGESVEITDVSEVTEVEDDDSFDEVQGFNDADDDSSDIEQSPHVEIGIDVDGDGTEDEILNPDPIPENGVMSDDLSLDEDEFSVSANIPQRNNTSISEVEDLDLGDDLDIGEDDYRKQAEQPKVVEKIVEVEKVVEKKVYVDSGKGKRGNSALEAILSGRTHRIFLVTGDRGSGVTTTAWDLAKAFSRKVQVLYVDMDYITHGLLCHLEYNQIIKYDITQLKGITLCKNRRSFEQCIINYDNNIDLLTCDYPIEVSDENVYDTQSVVIEMLQEYPVVIFDVPLEKLSLFDETLLTCTTLINVEQSTRGFMNLIVQLENSTLPVRIKRRIVGNGKLILTKCNKTYKLKEITGHVSDIVDLEEVNWLSMPILPRTGAIDAKFLASVVE